MSNSTLLSAAIAAISLLSAAGASAQDSYLTKANTPFDFNAAKNFVVLYAPDEAVTAMGSKIISNNNLDPNMVNNQFYYWTTDWDKTSLVLTTVDEPEGKNSLGGTSYINMTPLYEWGGGSFSAKGSWQYDLSKVNDNMILHIGLRDFGTVAPKFKIDVGRVKNIASNGFQLETNLAIGQTDGNYVGVGNMGHDGEWYYLEVPVKDLVDESGNYGFTYDFSSPFPVTEAAVQLSFAKPEVSVATGVLEPGNTVKTYTITKLGSAMSVDGIWFYEKESNGITDIPTSQPTTTPTHQPVIYDLSGRQVNTSSLPRGIYVVKTSTGVKKIAIQ